MEVPPGPALLTATAESYAGVGLEWARPAQALALPTATTTTSAGTSPSPSPTSEPSPEGMTPACRLWGVSPSSLSEDKLGRVAQGPQGL